MTVRRGHIYLVQLPHVERDKTALVVSSNVVNEFLKPVVVQVTTTDRIRSLPTFVKLSAGEGGLTSDSYALCHELHTLDDEFIDDDPIGSMIPIPRMVEVERALKHVLDLDEAA